MGMNREHLDCLIIGAGISGLTVASRLHGEHGIQVFEAAAHIGGHTHTVRAETARRQAQQVA